MDLTNKFSTLSKFKLNSSNNQTLINVELKNDIDTSNQRILSNSNFRRGIIKTNDSYFYYLLNETQANSYSQTYSAIKYNIDEETQQINVSPDKLSIKYYPRNLIKEYFSDSKLIEMQFSCTSKYKNLGKKHKEIQEIHEMIIRDDCILIVIEHFENNLKDFLDLNQNICIRPEQDELLPPRKEWFFTKMIYDICNKFYELTKIGIFFGTLINPYDISIRNLNVNLKDKYGADKTMANIEDVDFVLPNPFLYEIETIFMTLDNNITTKTFPPEMLEKFVMNKDKQNILEKVKNICFFNNLMEEENKEKQEMNLLDKSYGLIPRKFSSRLYSAEKREREEKKDSQIIHLNNLTFFLSEEEEKIQFDSWMLGLLIYLILQNQLPENLTKLKNIEEVKLFYSSSNFDFYKNKANGTLKPMEALFANKFLQEKKKPIGIEYIHTEISFVMKRIIGDAMKKNPKFRIYPHFVDCNDDLKIVDSIDQNSLSESFLSENLRNFHKDIRINNEKFFDEEKEIQFLIVKKNYIKPFLEEYDPERFEDFHLMYFFTPSNLNIERDKYLKLKKLKDLINFE